jgi:hypothetical protein
VTYPIPLAKEERVEQTKFLDVDIDSLPLDVFELVESGLAVESLTAGHGLPENAASSGNCSCIGGYCVASCTQCVSCSSSCSGGSPCGCGDGCNVPEPFRPDEDEMPA